MIASVSNSTSALAAYGKQMRVTANNVANIASDEFQKSRAVISERENGSVDVDIQKIETPGPMVTAVKDGEMVEKELSNVDLAEETVQTVVTQNGYDANLKSIQVQDEAMKKLIDTIG